MLAKDERLATDDEPIFVLRAQDRFAPATLLRWIELARENNVSVKKIFEAEDLMRDMMQWQRNNETKISD